jgi:energy-coupling factor transporter transmembrane protein EcfT
VGLILGLAMLGWWYVSRRARKRDAFIEKTVAGLVEAMRKSLFAENTARLPGFLQGLDPRVKLVGLGSLIVAVIGAQKLTVLTAVFAVAAVLAVISRVSVSRVWLTVATVTGMIALPALFLTHGTVLATIPFLEWRMTAQGLRAASFLVMRAETSATLATLLILSTQWNALLRALRIFRVPASTVVLVMMTYRYIFVFVESAKGIFEARRTRLVGYLEPAMQRRLAAAGAGALLDKTIQMSGEVHSAMLARGFRGEVRLLDDLRMKARDWWQLASLTGVAAIAVWLGR